MLEIQTRMRAGAVRKIPEAWQRDRVGRNVEMTMVTEEVKEQRDQASGRLSW